MLAVLIRLAPVGIAGLVGGLILLRSPFIGLLAMVVLIPAEELTTFIAGRTFVWVLGVATFGAWVLRILVRREKIKLSSVPTALAVLWLLWGIASFFWAYDQTSAWNRAIVLTQAIVFFVLLQNLITNNKRLKIVLLAYFASAVMCSLFAIGIEISTGIERVSLSGAQNPAHFAEALGIGLLMAPYMFSWSKRFFWKLLLALGSSGIMVAILLTGTRAVWVGLPGAVVFTWFATRGRAIRTRTLVTASVVLVVCFLLLAHYNIISNYIVQRVVALPSVEATRGGAGRTNIWWVGWEMVKDNPVIGVGLQNFPERFGGYIDIAGLRGAYAVYPGRDPHNIFLSIQSELGIVGFIVVGLFLGSILQPLLRCKGDPRATVGMLLFFFLVVSGFAITLLYRKYFWLSLGIAGVAPMAMNNERN